MYVYLILEVNHLGEESHKIGTSKNDPELRVKQLSTGNPNEIRLLHSYFSPNYRKIEQMLHKKFRAYKTLANNEWFKLDDYDVINFIKICQEQDAIVKLFDDYSLFDHY